MVTLCTHEKVEIERIKIILSGEIKRTMKIELGVWNRAFDFFTYYWRFPFQKKKLKVLTPNTFALCVTSH